MLRVIIIISIQMSGQYPVALRSILKGAPCLLMCVGMSYLFVLANYAFIRHEHDHVPKPYHKSTKTEAFLRLRDDSKRQYFYQMLEFNPNTQVLPFSFIRPY